MFWHAACFLWLPMSHTHRHVGTSLAGASDDGLLGAVVAEYRLVRLLGRGGMGRVFEGEHVHCGRRAAIKLVHSELSRNEQVAARFVNESRAAARVDHPGVVTVFEAGQTSDGFSYIVMEFLEGELLAQRINRWYGSEREAQQSARSACAPQLAERCMQIAWQIADTLSALHCQGIVHRDLKPENIFLVPEEGSRDRERAKIFDFGIAKLLQNSAPSAEGTGSSSGDSSAELPSPQTKIGTVLGTPIYMSPEQWQGQGKITDRADVYAAGGIFFELFTGFPPFRSQVLGQLLLSHMHQPPPLLEVEAPWLPAPVADVVQRMLAKDPNQRPSMDEVAEQLERHLTQTRVQNAKTLLPLPARATTPKGVAAPTPSDNTATSAPSPPSAGLNEATLVPSRPPDVDATLYRVPGPVTGGGLSGDASALPPGAVQTIISKAQSISGRRRLGRAMRGGGGDRSTRLVPAHPTILSGPVPRIPVSRPLPVASVPAPPTALNIAALCALGLLLTSVAALVLGAS